MPMLWLKTDVKLFLIILHPTPAWYDTIQVKNFSSLSCLEVVVCHYGFEGTLKMLSVCICDDDDGVSYPNNQKASFIFNAESV